MCNKCNHKMTGYAEKQRLQASQHFFAASTSTWMTTTPERDLPEVMRLMKSEGLGFNVFLVSLPFDADYEINFYQPQVHGTQWLGFFGETK